MLLFRGIVQAVLLLLLCSFPILAALSTGSGTEAACELRVLVIRAPESPDMVVYFTENEAHRLNEATRWLLDLCGMRYDEIEAADLTRDLLYDKQGLAYSVVVDNGNRLDAVGKDSILIEAVKTHGLGLVMHTASVAYVCQEMNLLEIVDKGWKDRRVWGEFSVTDSTHYITRLLYAPIEHVTHNLVGHPITTDAYVHKVEMLDLKTEGCLLASVVEPPEVYPVAPEVVAKEVGAGRIVWFARPFDVYLRASYYFVERDHMMALLLARAIEWASRDGVMISKWLYPSGSSCAHAIIMDGYYDYPPPGYFLQVTPPDSLGDLVQSYGIVEDFLSHLGQRYTACVIFRNNSTRGWDAGYNLMQWEAGQEALRQVMAKGNQLAMAAYDFLNYGAMAGSPNGRAAAVANLRNGREAMARILGVDNPVYIFSYVPDLMITEDVLYEMASEAGFDIMVGGIYKVDFPYDLYGSIYPYCLVRDVGGTRELGGVVIENNFFFDSITEEGDMYYASDVYRLHGALVARVCPWQIYDREDVLLRLKRHIERTRTEENVWWTTVGELGQFTLQRYDVEISGKSYDCGRKIVITVVNNGERAVEGFTVRVKLEDNSAPTSWGTEPMEIVEITRDSSRLEEGRNWALGDMFSGHPGSVLIWTDLGPGQQVRLEVTASGGRTQIGETAMPVLALLALPLAAILRRMSSRRTFN